jgi:signal transduction histidine kinase
MISLSERSTYYKQVQMEYWQEAPSKSISAQYQDLLRRYLACPASGLLGKAGQLGQRAINEGTGLLEFVDIHEDALADVIEDGGPQSNLIARIRAASRLLEAALSPYEAARLGCRETIASLRTLYQLIDDEARQVAHLLREDTTQILNVVQQELAGMGQDAPEPVIERINLMVSLLDDVREQVRDASHELRPLVLDQLGLLPALRFLALGTRKRSGLEVAVHGEIAERLSQPLESMLYRIVQEALENVVRHAHASLAEVRVWLHQGVVYCVVSDNGIGFEVPASAARKGSAAGLPGIDERVDSAGGECRVISKPGEGAQLQVAIPI